jgi:hypothetical protein
MADQLTATGAGEGSQTTTQSPQSNATSGSFGAGRQGSSVQPGTASSLLTSQNGLPLQSTQLSTVSLGSQSSSSTQAPTTTKTHHTSPLALGFSILLLVLAVAIFWGMARPVKNTSV